MTKTMIAGYGSRMKWETAYLPFGFWRLLFKKVAFDSHKGIGSRLPHNQQKLKGFERGLVVGSYGFWICRR
jgi:hypothetical protein